MTATPTVSTFDDAYPVVLRLTGRRVLVVGGGKVAVGKARGLLERGAQVTVVAPQVHPDMPVEVRVKRRRYRARDGRGAHLVFAATDDRAVNQAVFDDAEDRGVWACSVDDPDRCSFALPAVHRDGHVVIAVTTSGASPTLAQAVRDRCAAALPDDLGALDRPAEILHRRFKRRLVEIKLRAISDKIGYPDKWKTYETTITRDDAFGNAARLSELDYLRDLSKIGKAVDKSEWSMTPPTVNAYYDAQRNDINFPAGILQPPFFDNNVDDASNLGGIGAVIGHELTHGFDDEGRKFDGAGNLVDWWTEKDGEEFERRSDCFIKQYFDYAALPGVKLNGRLTLGENVADNGGVRIAYMAMQTLMGAKALKEKRGGYTPEQRFFYAYAGVWCQQYTEEAARMRANVDPHSPGRYRVNGVLGNSPEFRQAFGCKVGDGMVREQGCRIW